MRGLRIVRDRAGASAMEFAFVAPFLLIFLFGTFELARVFFADAGLKSAVGEGARMATLYPAPSDAEIKTKINSKMFDPIGGTVGTPTLARGETDGKPYVDITQTYSYTIDPIVLPSIPVTLTVSRRAYLQAD